MPRRVRLGINIKTAWAYLLLTEDFLLQMKVTENEEDRGDNYSIINPDVGVSWLVEPVLLRVDGADVLTVQRRG